MPSLHVSPPSSCVPVFLHVPSSESCNLACFPVPLRTFFSLQAPFLTHRMELSRSLAFPELPGCVATKQLFPPGHSSSPVCCWLLGPLSSCVPKVGILALCSFLPKYYPTPFLYHSFMLQEHPSRAVLLSQWCAHLPLYPKP